MKKLRFFEIALLAIFMCVNFTACSIEDETPELQSPKEYTVSFGFTGDILDVTESPLTRAVSNDLYGIQVYAIPNIETSTSYSGKYYAKGIFDDVSLMKLKLVEGYKYKFKIIKIIDGKEKSSPLNGTITNDFTYSNSYYLEGLDFGAGVPAGGSSCYNPSNIDSYYGEATDYLPQENGTVTIYMKRAAFGVKLVAYGLIEGTLNIAMPGHTTTMTSSTTDIEKKFTFGFPYLSNLYSNDNYSQDVSINISWTKADGAVVQLGTYNISFKRNKLTTVTIKVQDMSIDKGLGLTFDSEEMGEGDNITIENGSQIETPIVP